MTPERSDTSAARRAQRRAGGAVLFVVALLAACASQPTAGEGRAAQPVGERLARLADQQKAHPVRAAMTAPLPPGVDSATLAPVPETDQKARAPLAEVVDTLAAPTAKAEAHDGSPSAESLRLYISGRAKRLDGDTAGAIKDLKASAALDDSAAAPWREIGEASIQSGDRLSAVGAFREAIARDPDDARSLEQIGLAALDRRDAREAAAMLARAWRVSDARDPWFKRVVAVGLGKSLHELGYLAAGDEALTYALNLPDRIDQPTIYIVEVSAIYRERGDLWRDVGDSETRLGRFEQALAAYDKAADLPTFDPGAVAARRVNIAMRLGRPAAGAQVVAQEIADARGRVEDRHLRLIEYLARYSEIGPLLAREIDAVDATLSEPERRVAASRLARARAAALPDAQARAVLRDRLATAPADENAIADLFGRFDPADLRGLTREATTLVEASPLEERRYAAALLRTQPSAEALLEALPHGAAGASASPGELLLRASLLDASGKDADAEQTLRALVRQKPEFAPGVVALARLLADSGRREEAVRLLDSIDETKDRDLRLAKALALQAVGDYEGALFALKPSLEGGPDASPRPAEALLAAQLCSSLERWPQAEQWCATAVELDPTLEDAYAGLIALYAPNGPLADGRKLSDTVRSLRAAVPSSRTLRWLRAQDLARSGQYDQAERDLLGLAEEEPSPAVVELLVTLWQKTGSLDRAEKWLREKTTKRPTDGVLVSELARLLGDTGRGEEAVQLLREWLAVRPNDAVASRRLESVLRDDLHRTDEADELALRRLAAAPPSLARALELAEITTRKGDPNAAVDILLEGLRGARGLRPEEVPALSKAAFDIGQLANAGKADPAKALDLCNATVDLLPKAPLAIHNLRLMLMARTESDPERIVAAVGLAAAQNPDVSVDLILQAADLLDRAGRKPDALAVLERCAQKAPQLDNRLIGPWIKYSLDTRNGEAAARLVRTAANRGAVESILRVMGSKPMESTDKGAAAFAYALAGEFAREGQEDNADLLYRVVISYDPTHAMANNNLGYRMLERGQNIAEAQRLLETAYAQSPDQMEVIDSLGWARYKLGVFEDEKDAAGAVVRQGAVTLLEKAAATQDGADDPTIHDHLGDALWRAGRKGDAATQWQRVVAITRELLKKNLVRRDEVQKLADSAKAKLDAVGADQDPPVADVIGKSPSVAAPAGAPTGVGGNGG